MKKILLFLVLITSVFSVSIIELEIVNLFFVFILGTIALPGLIDYPFNKKFISFYSIWLLPFIIALGISLPINLFFFSREGLHFHEMSPYGRMSNLLMLTIVIFYSYSFVCINGLIVIDNVRFLIKTYFLSCFLMVFTAFWQWMSFNNMIWIKFPIETRSYVHGNTSLSSISSRLTGLAMEPSFLVPFVSEFIIIGLFIVKKKIYRFFVVTCGVLTIFYSFSPSGYLSLLGIFMTFFFFKYRMKALFLTCLLFIFGSSFLFYFKNLDAIVYFTDRIAGADGSSRFETINYLLYNMGNNNYFSLLFGNGFKSLSVLQYTYPHAIIYETSNNLFLDVFFEAGILGVFIMVVFFAYTIKAIFRIKDNGNKLFATLLLVNFIITSLFRADFSSIRVFFILFIIYLLCTVSEKIHVLDEKY